MQAIFLTLLCTAGQHFCSAQYQYPVVSVETPEGSVCPLASVLASVRDEEIDLNDTTELNASECGGYG